MSEEEIFGIVRKNYREVNEEYFKKQLSEALKYCKTMSLEDCMDKMLDWIVIAGCASVNEYYREVFFNAISYLLDEADRAKREAEPNED